MVKIRTLNNNSGSPFCPLRLCSIVPSLPAVVSCWKFFWMVECDPDDRHEQLQLVQVNFPSRSRETSEGYKGNQTTEQPIKYVFFTCVWAVFGVRAYRNCVSKPETSAQRPSRLSQALR